MLDEKLSNTLAKFFFSFQCTGWQQMHSSRESHHSEVQWVILSRVEIRRLVRGEMRRLLIPQQVISDAAHFWASPGQSRVKPAAPLSHLPLKKQLFFHPPCDCLTEHDWSMGGLRIAVGLAGSSTIIASIGDLWSFSPSPSLLFQTWLSCCKGNQNFINYKAALV